MAKGCMFPMFSHTLLILLIWYVRLQSPISPMVTEFLNILEMCVYQEGNVTSKVAATEDSEQEEEAEAEEDATGEP